MKKITLYFTLLITTILSPELLAQQKDVHDISWAITSQIPAAHGQTQSFGLAGAAIGLTAHKLIIAGGTNFPDQMPWDGGEKHYYNDIFIYETTAGLLLKSTNSKLPFNLAYGAVCNTSKGIVIAGGENENGLLNKVLLLNWKAGTLMVSYLPELPRAVTNAALTPVGNMLYLAGGEINNGTTNQFLSLNLNELDKGWRTLTPLPQAVSHMVLLSAKFSGNNEIYLIGGRKKNPSNTSTLYKQVYAFNIKQQTWIVKKPLPYPIAAATGIQNEGSILIFSGDKGETFHKAESLIATIALEKDAAKKEILNQQKAKLQAAHPGFSKTVLKYDLVRGNWTALKSLMPYGTVTTHAVFLNNEVIIAGGEIRAGVRTPNIIVGKLK